MLPLQGQLPLSNHLDLYDIVVPRDNMLRQINDLIDFRFVHDELTNKYCLDNGRMAQSPVRMFKYLLLKVIFDISDVDVVERSRYDMSFKYFLGMTPEEGVINPSSLTKFRHLRLKDMDLMNLLIGKTVEIAIQKELIKSKTIIVDATHTLSKTNPHSPLEFLKMRSKNLRKVIYQWDEKCKERLPAKNEDNDLGHELEYIRKLIELIASDPVLPHVPIVKEKLSLLEEALEDTADHYTVSSDPDARVGHKSEEDPFFGYKTHIAMSDERIITGVTVTSGEKGDGGELPELIEQSRRNGMEIKTVIGDTAYSGKDNLELTEKEKIALVSKLNPVISNGLRKEADKFDYNKDADRMVCPAGHMAISKYKHKPKGNRNARYTYYFDTEKCKTCSLREGCYKEGTKSKTYSVIIKAKEHQAQEAFEQTDRFRKLYRERYKIEAKNAELKNRHGYDRAWSIGLPSMQMQGAVTIFVVNIKRILTLMKD
ncbi:MAG: IS1182 family transposase [Prevotellaceae bacterium]|jgi:transposase|nr:IS1182 family transposase [Prevotellaceae bacterium]